MTDRPPPALTPDWLGHRASAHPDRPALVAGRTRLTFRDLDRLTRRTARQLAALGVAEGMRVALLLPGGVSFAVLAHALARLGTVMVPLNTRLAPAELAWQVTDSRAEVVIAAGDGMADPAGVRTIGLDALAAAPDADVPLRDRIDLSAPQGIIYTSATSGRPKGVVLTFGNHWWNAVASALHLGLRRDDCWLAPLPLYHVGGLAVLWRSVIYGIPAVVHETFEPEAVNREIDGGQVTLVSVVSTMLQRMLEARRGRPYPPTLRAVLLGGGPAPPSLIEACLEQGVPVAPTYGLTEAASQVATLPPEEVAARRGSSGRALFPVEVRIAPPGGAADRGGPPAEPGRTGEILVRGPTVMAGYADRPEETARALRDGWLHTGDLGSLDEDGYLYVLDRRDDLIISGGENVYPAEVEAVLRSHPAVLEAVVFGITDAVWGEGVAAAVTLRPGASVREDDVRGFCAGRLARYKVPKRIWVVEDLPRSPGGKVMRRTLREWAEEAAARERA